MSAIAATTPTSTRSRNGHAPFLEMRGISKRFGGVQALLDVDFEVYGGECVALMGDNGAGKSTLIRILTGLYPPDAGEIVLDGKPVTIGSVEQARHLGIETLLQDLALCDNLDSACNFFLGREPSVGFGPFRFARRRLMEEETERVLASIGMKLPSGVAVRGYSGGQRQALALGRSIKEATRVLILDEPTAALGLRERNEVMAVVKRLREERGLSIVLITHNIEELRALADRVVVLRRGQRVGELDVASAPDEDVVALITGAKST